MSKFHNKGTANTHLTDKQCPFSVNSAPTFEIRYKTVCCPHHQSAVICLLADPLSMPLSDSLMFLLLEFSLGTTSFQPIVESQPSPSSSFSLPILRTILSSLSCLRTCPIHFCCRLQMVSTRQYLSPTLASTSTFVILSVQLTLSVLQNHMLPAYMTLQQSCWHSQSIVP